MTRRKSHFVCKLGLLHHPMTSVAGFRKTQSGTRFLRKVQLPATQETFLGRITAEAYHVPGKPGAVQFWSWLSSILDKCALRPPCADLRFVLHLLFRNTATKKLPQFTPEAAASLCWVE